MYEELFEQDLIEKKVRSADHNLDKPLRYDLLNDEWLIFPNTVLSHIHISDCANTVNGVCIDDKTIEQCIELCNNDDSGVGYHVQFDDNRSICVPIRTSHNPELNPVHRFRKQSIYPAFDNVAVSTFINTKKFPFPPGQTNVVFYKDILMLKNEDINILFGGKKYLLEGGEITGFSSDSQLNINLLPYERIESQVANYLPLQYGDYFNINVPGTTLLLTKGANTDNLQWIQGRGLAEPEYAKFQILPFGDEKKLGDLVNYGDVFIIEYNSTDIAVVDKDYRTFVVKGSANTQGKRAKQTDFPYFSFVSKMMGYYCEDKKCKSIPIIETQPSGNSNTYKGKPVNRVQGCWGICDYFNPNTKQMMISPFKPSSESFRETLPKYWFIIPIILVIIIFITGMYFVHKNG